MAAFNAVTYQHPYAAPLRRNWIAGACIYERIHRLPLLQRLDAASHLAASVQHHVWRKCNWRKRRRQLYRVCLPGILVMVVLTGAGMSGIANYSLKAGGSFYRIFISPVKRSTIVLGHILNSTALAFIEISILLYYLYCSVHSNYQHIPAAIVFVSTTYWPYGKIPGIFHIPVSLNPCTHIIHSLRNVISSNSVDWSQFLFSTVLLAALCSLSFGLAVHCLRKDNIG